MTTGCEATLQAAHRATSKELDAVEASLNDTAEEYVSCADPIRLMELDEALLSGNAKVQGMLQTIYDKIRFVRSVELRRLQAAVRTTTEGYRAILTLVRNSDALGGAEAMRSHIDDHSQNAPEAVRLAFADLYLPREELA